MGYKAEEMLEREVRERQYFKQPRMYIKCILTVCVCVFLRDKLTSTGPIRHQHVTVEAVALVTPICIHAPVFTRPRLQPTLIQVCRHKERETEREREKEEERQHK